MADVSNLLSTSLALNGIDHGWQVVGAHIEPGEVPELLLVMVWVQAYVRSAVCVSTRVAEPDIVAGASGNEGWSDVRVVHDPAVGRVEDAVLEQNGRLGHVGLAVADETWDAEDVQNVAIFGGHFMNLELEAILLANLLKRALGIASVAICLDRGHLPEFLLLGERRRCEKSNANAESLHMYLIKEKIFIIINQSNQSHA